jgi:multiple sugar transport system ATP-binding protein
MDEPLSNLDAKLRVQMRTEIGRLHNRLNTTFIYVTHDQTEAMTMGTRIVVMKDGYIQQVDSPTSLYDRPCNQFVATFIGSPQMNLINAVLTQRGADLHLVFGKNDIKIPEGKAKKLEGTDYVGKEVIVGIRPENLHDEAMYLESMQDSIVEAHVDLVEMLGAETFLYMIIDGAASTVTARVNARSKTKTGDVIKVALDANKIHLFDKETERTIIN